MLPLAQGLIGQGLAVLVAVVVIVERRAGNGGNSGTMDWCFSTVCMLPLEQGLIGQGLAVLVAVVVLVAVGRNRARLEGETVVRGFLLIDVVIIVESILDGGSSGPMLVSWLLLNELVDCARVPAAVIEQAILDGGISVPVLVSWLILHELVDRARVPVDWLLLNELVDRARVPAAVIEQANVDVHEQAIRDVVIIFESREGRAGLRLIHVSQALLPATSAASGCTLPLFALATAVGRTGARLEGETVRGGM